MDATNPSATPTFASRTPLHVGAVAIVARDLEKLTAYYKELLRLSEIKRTKDTVVLGTGGLALLELIHRPDALPDDNREAGLYHTAFLMPTRVDHARWIMHAAKSRIPITGASDHGVSEAIYLDDPEGNGVEVYNDRPAELWLREGANILQKTDPLDIDDIVREIDPATATYPAAPEGLRVGHVHLRVGDIAQAEKFYCDVIGLAITRRRTGATFVSTGGYHHHVAVNVWHSHGAGPRDDNRAGLAWFELQANDAATYEAVTKKLKAANAPMKAIPNGIETLDPWGTRIRFVES